MDTADDFFEEVIYRTVNLEIFGVRHGSGHGYPGATVREEPTLAKKHPQAQRWELGIPTSEPCALMWFALVRPPCSRLQYEGRNTKPL